VVAADQRKSDGDEKLQLNGLSLQTEIPTQLRLLWPLGGHALPTVVA
jgi:hypothetical protein